MAIRITHETACSITDDHARQMQAVGLDAWSQALERRSKSQIRGFYNPDDVGHVTDVGRRYREVAEHGVVSLALDDETDNQVVGFLLAQDEVSGNIAARALKRMRYPDKIYAWLMQINVAPEYQGQGIGKRLLKTGLETFRPEQIPTAYIFDENKLVWDAARRLGFDLSPPEQEPREMDYFGKAHPPVMQYRFAADSVEAVLEKL